MASTGPLTERAQHALKHVRKAQEFGTTLKESVSRLGLCDQTSDMEYICEPRDCGMKLRQAPLSCCRSCCFPYTRPIIFDHSNPSW
jgi:hypothetical protein